MEDISENQMEAKFTALQALINRMKDPNGPEQIYRVAAPAAARKGARSSSREQA